MRDPRVADVAQHKHVAASHELTRTHVDAYTARRINQAKLIGPTGIVGPRDRIGGRTRLSGRHKVLKRFHLIQARLSFHFFHVGLNVVVCVQVTWQSVGSWIKVHESALVDLMDSGPPDYDQTHVLNSKPLIELVKSDGCNLISHSANKRTTRGCLRTLR